MHLSRVYVASFFLTMAYIFLHEINNMARLNADMNALHGKLLKQVLLRLGSISASIFGRFMRLSRVYFASLSLRMKSPIWPGSMLT